jgi:hypothetical protein
MWGGYFLEMSGENPHLNTQKSFFHNAQTPQKPHYFWGVYFFASSNEILLPLSSKADADLEEYASAGEPVCVSIRYNASLVRP